jgi:hypothetical protein
MKDISENFDTSRIVEVFEIDLICLLRCSGEIGVDDKPIHVAHNQQSRIFQSLPIEQELVVRGTYLSNLNRK